MVDDDEKICWAFEQFLADEGYTPIIANNAEEGLRKIQAAKPDVVLLDIRFPGMGMNGLQALKQIKSLYPELIVIIMTAQDTPETTIEAMTLQAFDFLPKPIDLDQVKEILDRATKLHVERSKIAPSGVVHDQLYAEAEQPQGRRLVGKSPQMREIYKYIGIMASNTLTVLIEGESGTGKVVLICVSNASSISTGNKSGSGKYL